VHTCARKKLWQHNSAHRKRKSIP